MAQTTVVEADDMVLRHQRVVAKNELPRKLANGRLPLILLPPPVFLYSFRSFREKASNYAR